MKRHRRRRPVVGVPSAFAGFRFPAEVIMLVRWYLRYCLSYRDVEELLAERGVEVDHVLLSDRRDATAARRFFTVALSYSARPAEVTTDRAAVYPRVVDESVP